MLDPSMRTFDVTAYSGRRPEERALPSILSLDQSLLVVWPQFIGLIALTAAPSRWPTWSFMRQEVRAIPGVSSGHEG